MRRQKQVHGMITYSMGIRNKAVKHEYALVQIRRKVYRFNNGNWELLTDEGATSRFFHIPVRGYSNMIFVTLVADDRLESAEKVLSEYRREPENLLPCNRWR